jgi:hypothetical protein
MLVTRYTNGVRLDVDKLCDMVDYLIDSSYVAHNGTVYKQVIGMAMGVHNAPQIANLYCAYYKLHYIILLPVLQRQHPRRDGFMVASFLFVSIFCLLYMSTTLLQVNKK